MTQINSQAFSGVATQASSSLLSRAIALINNQALTSLESMRAGIASGAVTVRLMTPADELPPTAKAGYIVDPNSGQGQILLNPELLERSSDAVVLFLVDNLRHEFEHHVTLSNRVAIETALTNNQGTPDQRGSTFVTGTIDDETNARMAGYEFRQQVAQLPGTEYKASNTAILKTDGLYKGFTDLALDADQRGLSGQAKIDHIVEGSRAQMAAYDQSTYRESAIGRAALLLGMTPEQAIAFRGAVAEKIRNAVPYQVDGETFDDGSAWVNISYSDGRKFEWVFDSEGNEYALNSTTPNQDASQTTTNYTYIDGEPTLQSSTTPQIFDDGSRVEYVSKRQPDGSVVASKDVYDSDNQLFSSEPIYTGANALANAVGVTASVLSLIKQVTGRNPQLVPVLTAGVNTVLAIQAANEAPTDRVLSGAGAVLGAFSSLYALDYYAKAGDGLGVGVSFANSVSYGAIAYSHLFTEATGRNTAELLSRVPAFGPNSIVTQINTPIEGLGPGGTPIATATKFTQIRYKTRSIMWLPIAHYGEDWHMKLASNDSTWRMEA